MPGTSNKRVFYKLVTNLLIWTNKEMKGVQGTPDKKGDERQHGQQHVCN